MIPKSILGRFNFLLFQWLGVRLVKELIVEKDGTLTPDGWSMLTNVRPMSGWTEEKPAKRLIPFLPNGW